MTATVPLFSAVRPFWAGDPRQEIIFKIVYRKRLEWEAEGAKKEKREGKKERRKKFKKGVDRGEAECYTLKAVPKTGDIIPGKREQKRT